MPVYLGQLGCVASFEVQNDPPPSHAQLHVQLKTQCDILQHKKKIEYKIFFQHKFFFNTKLLNTKLLNTKFLNTRIVVLKKNFQHEIVVLNKKFSVEKKFCVGHIIIVM